MILIKYRGGTPFSLRYRPWLKIPMSCQGSIHGPRLNAKPQLGTRLWIDTRPRLETGSRLKTRPWLKTGPQLEIGPWLETGL